MHYFETIWPVEKVENWGVSIISTKKNYKPYEHFLGKVKYWFACYWMNANLNFESLKSTKSIFKTK